MFRFSERLSPSGSTDPRRYLKRAVLFAGGLVLLWTALQLFPSSPAEPPVYSDEAGSVASSEQVRTSYQGPRLFTLGNLAALVILIGGGGFAFYLHKRSAQSSGDTPYIESIGEIVIGQGQQLRLVRCGGEILLLGATAHEITLLRDFDPAVFDSAVGNDTVGGDGASHDRQPHSDHDRQPHPDHDRQPHSEPTPRITLTPKPVNTSSHFADVLRQYAGRYASNQSNGRT